MNGAWEIGAAMFTRASGNRGCPSTAWAAGQAFCKVEPLGHPGKGEPRKLPIGLWSLSCPRLPLSMGVGEGKNPASPSKSITAQRRFFLEPARIRPRFSQHPAWFFTWELGACQWRASLVNTGRRTGLASKDDERMTMFLVWSSSSPCRLGGDQRLVGKVSWEGQPPHRAQNPVCSRQAVNGVLEHNNPGAVWRAVSTAECLVPPPAAALGSMLGLGFGLSVCPAQGLWLGFRLIRSALAIGGSQVGGGSKEFL